MLALGDLHRKRAMQRAAYARSRARLRCRNRPLQMGPSAAL